MFKCLKKLILISLIFYYCGCHTVNKDLKTLTGKIIIDPGHGGEDSGALGKRGLKEKDVTLDISKRLARLFRKLEPNVKVILTRNKDKYESIYKRVEIANNHQAQAFISIHINSSESKEASGFEIYSLDVAHDRYAERLAREENKELKKNINEADFILADLRAFSHRSDSDLLANYLRRGLKNQIKTREINIHDRGYNQAIFHVLFVKMPAVLVELFFISNPKEELMLSRKKSREEIARGLFVGLKKFLNQQKNNQDQKS